jgi:AcrR family transcriptional regulator
VNPSPAPDSATSGRRRDPSIDERVLAATRASLVDHGWDGTSIRGIADLAGVSRPAIARRWPSKAHLVLESLLGSEPDLMRFEGADLDGWIDGVIDGSFELFDRPEVRSALPGLLATLRDHDDLRAAIWDGFSQPASDLVLDQGAGTSTAVRSAIAVAAGAALFSSVLVGDDAELRDGIRELLRTVLAGAVHTDTPAKRRMKGSR